MGNRQIVNIMLALVMLAASVRGGIAPQPLPAAAAREEAAAVLAGRTIVLDPGHGGPDGGAVGRGGLSEKNLLLDIALRLKGLLENAGVKVILTRETDRDLAALETRSLSRRKREDLAARAALANLAEPDAFVSLHANAFPSMPSQHGAQTFFLDTGPHAAENRRLATALQDELRRLAAPTTRLPNQGIDQYLLREVRAPAATAELGFLSNPGEERLLGTPDYRQQLAWGLFAGLAHYFQEGPQPLAGPASVNQPAVAD